MHEYESKKGEFDIRFRCLWLRNIRKIHKVTAGRTQNEK